MLYALALIYDGGWGGVQQNSQKATEYFDKSKKENHVPPQLIEKHSALFAADGQYWSINNYYRRRIINIAVWHGVAIDSIQIGIRGGESSHYGGPGGGKTQINFTFGQYLTGISGTSGIILDSITFHTNKENYGPYGNPNGGSYFELRPGTGEIFEIYGKISRDKSIAQTDLIAGIGIRY